MELFLSKFLPQFLYPIGLITILIILALVFRKRTRLQVALLIISLAVIWLAGNRWTAFSLARSLEWRYFPPSEIPEDQVTVVLGGGTDPYLNPRPMVEVNSAGDRITYTAALFNEGVSSRIILSGGGIDWFSPENSPAYEMYELLQLMGVPEKNLVLETKSRNTYENAFNTKQILQQENINQVLLVTSASHMPRAVRLFEEQGLEVTPMPVDYTVTLDGWNQLWHGTLQSYLLNLIPQASNLSLTTKIFKEYLGMLYYSLRGWQ